VFEAFVEADPSKSEVRGKRFKAQEARRVTWFPNDDNSKSTCFSFFSFFFEEGGFLSIIRGLLSIYEFSNRLESLDFDVDEAKVERLIP
jgi:hypothetical protein